MNDETYMNLDGKISQDRLDLVEDDFIFVLNDFNLNFVVQEILSGIYF